MRWSFVALAFALLSATAFAVDIGACRDLNESGIFVLNQSVAINASSCFNVTAPNVALNCAGFPVTGNNTTNTYGVYSNQTNTTIRNCIVSAFQTGIFLNNSNNGTVDNATVNTTHSAGYGIYLLGSSGNFITGSTAYSRAYYGIRIHTGSNFNTITGTNAFDSTIGIALDGSSNNTLANSNAVSSGNNYAVLLSSNANNTITNVTATTNNDAAFYFSASNFNTVRNTTATSPATAFRLSVTSSNNLIENSVASSTGSFYAVILENNANNNRLSNVSIASPNGAGVRIGFYPTYPGASGNIISGSTIVAGTDKAVILEGAASNTFANNTIRSNTTSVAQIDQVSNSNIFYNNTLISTNGAATLLHVNVNSSGNTFYWNNFSATTGLYVNDSNGSNFYNTTVSGHGEGNIWANVMNGSVQITGTNSSAGFPSLYYGTNGGGYPYNSSNSQGKAISNVIDFAPLTNQQASPPPGGNGTNGSITGRVFMPDGSTPVYNASVTLSGSTNSSTSTNESGGFSFTSLPWPSGFVLQARGTGFMANMQSNIENINLNGANYAATQNLNMQEQGGAGGACTHNGTFSVSGFARVVNESGTFNITSTSVGVELKTRNATCGPYDMSCFYAANQSNSSSGAYTVGCLEAGNYTMMAFGGGGPNQQGSGFMMQPLNISITNESITGLNINLSRDQRGPQGCNGNASIYGYIYSNNSGAITYLSNVQVFAGIFSSSGGGNFCGGGGQTSSSGLYNITGLQAGTYMLNVMPPTSSGFSEVHLSPEQAITLGATDAYQKNFSLSASGFVSGYVLGNNSQGSLVPVSGAYVNAFSPTMGGAWSSGSTNGAGFYNISITPGSSYELNVNPPYGSGYSTGRATGITVTSGQTTTVSNITLRLGASVSGYVVNQQGAGIPNVGVNAHPKFSFGPGGEWAFTQTNGSGYFTLAGLQANSTYILDAFPFDPNSNYSNGNTEVTLSDGSNSINIVLVTGNAISGRVTCNNSGTVQNVSFAQIQFIKVQNVDRGPDMMFGSMESGTFAFTMADNNGMYTARGLKAGNYSLRAELPWGSTSYNCSTNTTTVELSGSQTLNITLPQAIILSGRVNSSSGNVSGAFVNAFQPSTTGGPGMGGPSGFAQTDANGFYSMRLSPSSTASYIISVFPPPGTTYAQSEVRRIVNETSTQNFTLSSGGGIRGKVVNTAGTGIQFAGVNAFSENARSFGFSNSLSDGTFEVRGLASATDFRLFIQPPSTAGGIVPTFLENIAVVAGQTTDVGTITATTSDSYLLVTLLDGTTAIASANVRAWRPFTPYFGFCTTNTSGQCNMTGLASGSYDIFVEPTGTRPPWFDNATLESGSNSKTINYNSTGTLYSLNGTVVNSTGGAIANADVGIWNEATRFGLHAVSDGSGVFSFTGIPGSTTYKFGARKQGYLDNVSSVSIAAANATQSISLLGITASGRSLVTIGGTLVSTSGVSVATKSVVIVDVANASFFSDYAVTNSSGQYAFTNVPAISNGNITYRLTAIMGNQTFNSTQVVSGVTNYTDTVNITVS